MSIPFLLLLWSSAFFVVRFSREHIYIVCRVSAYELMVHLVNGGTRLRIQTRTIMRCRPHIDL